MITLYWAWTPGPGVLMLINPGGHKYNSHKKYRIKIIQSNHNICWLSSCPCLIPSWGPCIPACGPVCWPGPHVASASGSLSPATCGPPPQHHQGLLDSVEKLSPKESSEDAHTVLRGAAPKDSVSIQGTSWGDSFSTLPWGFGTVAMTIRIMRPSSPRVGKMPTWHYPLAQSEVSHVP